MLKLQFDWYISVTFASFASFILKAQWPAVFVLHVCEIMNAKLRSLRNN